MRRAAADVLLAVAVVAKHSPAGAGQLQRDDRDEEHADERVHGHERAESQERCALHDQEHQQQRRDGGGQLLVPVAPTAEEPSHQSSKAAAEPVKLH